MPLQFEARTLQLIHGSKQYCIWSSNCTRRKHRMENLTHAYVRIYWFFPPECHEYGEYCAVNAHKYQQSATTPSNERRNIESEVSVLHIEATHRKHLSSTVASEFNVRDKSIRENWCPSEPHSPLFYSIHSSACLTFSNPNFGWIVSPFCFDLRWSGCFTSWIILLWCKNTEMWRGQSSARSR